MSQQLRLRRDVRVVPMVNHWYATPYLIPPHTFGLTTVYSHLPLAYSFMEDPQTHQRCARSSSLRGGPFVDHRGDPADVQRWIDRTQERCAAWIAQADATVRLFDQVKKDAKGMALDGMYSGIDPMLEGCVELSYDVCKQPVLRFIEPVIYRRHALDTMQSCRLELATRTERPFILSTPMVDAPCEAVDIQAPFHSPLWDLLCARSAGMDWGQWAEMIQPHLADPTRELPRLRDLFEPLSPVRGNAGYESKSAGVRMRYFGHACVLLESPAGNVLIDPLVGDASGYSPSGFTLEDLPPHIDFVLITHPHADHLVLETLLQLRHKIGTVVVGRSGGGTLPDISPKLLLQQCGFADVVALDEYETLSFAGGEIAGAPFYGEHGGLDVRSKATFAVTLCGRRFVFLSDSNPPTARCYRELRDHLGSVDQLFLGMECVGAPASWAYGPMLRTALTRAEDQSRRLNGSDAERAVELVEYFRADNNFIYAMGAEPWVTHISSIVPSPELPQFIAAERLLSHATAHGLHAERLFGAREMVLVPRVASEPIAVSVDQ